jgi:hypothetical protein
MNAPQLNARGRDVFDLLLLQYVIFPVPAKNFPVTANIFPVNLCRELSEKLLQQSGFLLCNGFSKPRNRKIPGKIPC